MEKTPPPMEKPLDKSVRRPTPYEFCVTAETVRTTGVIASVELTYENEPTADPSVFAQTLTLR